MKIKFATPLFLIASFTLFGCKEKTIEEKTEENIKTYATAYFNWDFPLAKNYALNQNKKWLTFLASQVTDKDISALREKEKAAEVEIDNIEYKSDDNSALITIIVTNFLHIDSIGKTPQCCEEAKYTIKGEKEKDVWKFERPKACD